MRILIVGGDGQLGTRLNLLLKKKNEIYSWDIEELDITKGQETINKINNLSPEVIINAAAYTEVDGCEENVDLAYKVNAFGVRNLAVAAKKCGAKLVHVSTDFIFSGDTESSYLEFDDPNPISVYGKSKLVGEQFVKNLCSQYFIVRTAWLYGDHGDNFVTTMLSLAQERAQLKIVDDQIGTPTYAKDLAQVIKKLIETDLFGTYHASNSGQASWYQFAEKIFEYSNTEIEVKPITSEQFPQVAERPKFSVMQNYSLKQNLGYEMRNWEDGLKDYFNK